MRDARSQTAAARYWVMQAAAGAALGIFWGAFMLLTNTGAIETLLSRSQAPIAGTILFLVGSASTIAPVFLAIAIGRLALEKTGDELG